MQKTTPNYCRKFLPPPGGEFDIGVEKKSKNIFLQITMGKFKKRRSKKLCNKNYFCTKNSAKMQKMTNKKSPGRKRKTDFGFNLGIPRPGGLHKISPTGGIYTLLNWL